MSGPLDRLRAAHHLALRAQSASAFDAEAMIRSWPRLAHTAHHAAARLIRTPDDDLATERIDLAAQAFTERCRESQWPGSGPVDDQLLRITLNLKAAADAPGEQLAEHESSEAHHLLMGTLWTTSRMISRAARDQIYDLKFSRPSARITSQALAASLSDTHRRFNAIEQLAVNGMHHHRQRTMEHPERTLRHAVATWDIEAHRALLRDRSTAVLHVLAHQQAVGVKALQVYLDSAHEAHVVDDLTHQRLTPVLDRTARSWVTVRDLAAEFSFSTTPIPTSLLHAGAQLSAQLHHGITSAGPDDRPAALMAMSNHLASSVAIASATHDLIKDGQLRGPARAIARTVGRRRHVSKDSVVDIRAVHRGLTIELPESARDILELPTMECVLNTHEAVNRAAGLDPLYRNDTEPSAPTPESPPLSVPSPETARPWSSKGQPPVAPAR